MTTARKHHKKEAAIAALLVAPTLADAAKAIGVSEQTIWRWMQDEDFRSAYREAKKQVLEQAVGQLQAATGKAVNTLLELLKDEVPPATRHQAAKTILEFAYKGYEIEELESRIAELEKAIGKNP